MAIRQVKDAIDLSTNEPIYFKGHAKATFLSDGSTVEDKIQTMGKLNEDELNSKADAIKCTEITMTNNVIYPNTYNRITLENVGDSITCQIEPTDKSVYSEYMVEVTCKEGVECKIAFVNNATGEDYEILWANGEQPTFVSDTTYVISIIGNCAVYGKFTKPEVVVNPVLLYNSLYELNYDLSLIGEVVSHEWDSSTGDGVVTFSSLTGVIPDYMFENAYPINSMTIPEGVTEIGRSAFASSYIKSIVLPETLTHIGESAFSCCSSLSEITIPENVTTLGDYLFEDCSDLRNIYVKPTTPPTLEGGGWGLFMYLSSSGYTIYVPMNSVDSYKSSDWSQFSSRIFGYEF